MEIEKQRRLNEILTETQNIQKAMMDNSLVGYYIALDGRFFLMNPVAVSYTGYTIDEIIGMKADALIHPEDKSAVKRNARAMLRSERTIPHEFRIVTKQKKICWVIEALTPVLIGGKKAILSNTMDITEGRLAEQALKTSDNFYKTIFETTGTSTIIYEEDKTIFLVNSQFEKLTGYRKEEWEGKKKWDELIAPQDRAKLNRYHRLRRGSPGRRAYEFHLVDSKGKIKTLLCMVDVIPGTKKIVSSSIDITELKEKENELIAKSRILEELNSTLKVLLKQREEDREEMERALMSNIKDMVFPYIKNIRKNGIDKKNSQYLEMLSSNLENIFSPFTHKLSSKFMLLTPKEIQVANLIKDGQSSKEIAELLNVSSAAVDVCRYRIRGKLGLKNQKNNLQSYLKTLS